MVWHWRQPRILCSQTPRDWCASGGYLKEQQVDQSGYLSALALIYRTPAPCLEGSDSFRVTVWFILIYACYIRLLTTFKLTKTGECYTVSSRITTPKLPGYFSGAPSSNALSMLVLRVCLFSCHYLLNPCQVHNTEKCASYDRLVAVFSVSQYGSYGTTVATTVGTCYHCSKVLDNSTNMYNFICHGQTLIKLLQAPSKTTPAPAWRGHPACPHALPPGSTGCTILGYCQRCVDTSLHTTIAWISCRV